MAGLWDLLKSLTGAPPGAAPASEGIRADPQRSAQMDDHVLGQLNAGEPGVALAIVKDGAVVHAAGYGLADLRAQTPVTPGTIFISQAPASNSPALAS